MGYKLGVKWVFGSLGQAKGQAKGQGKVECTIRSVKSSIRRLAQEKNEVMKLMQEICLAKLDTVREEAVSMQIDQWAKRIAAHEKSL